ncbi:MAG: hypothetical protein HZC49_14325 [Nitrospirae bacterium]|nr:hypothetical protein [Nitrospirota bacterium]
MKFNLDNFSIVVLAQAHNPTVLNPDFLKNNKIIDPSFTPNNVICTPPVAQISYIEGLSIIAEFEKLQFIDTEPKRIPFESPIPEIANKYINVLPHVRYKAAGLNFIGHYLCKDKEFALSLLPRKFLKEGSWSTYGDETPSTNLKFTYSLKNIKCTISLETAELLRPNEPSLPILGINANYHIDSTSLEEIVSFINNWQTQFNHFSKVISDTFPEVE